MKKIIFTLFSLIIATITFSQEDLSRKQMYQDFDQLVKIFEEGNSQLYVRKQVTGYDNLAAIKSLRKNIDTISSGGSFHAFLKYNLSQMMDLHTMVEYNFYLGMDDLESIDTVAMRNLHQIEHEKRSKRTSIILEIPPLYYNNNYYLIGNHNLVNGTDTIPIYYMKLLSYNGKDFNSYIHEICRKESYRFNYKNKEIYYDDWFSIIPRKGRLRGEQDGRIIEFNIEDYPGALIGSVIHIPLEEVPNGINFIKKERIYYFEEDSILYVYIDRMQKDISFYERIKETGKDKPINKIILDVRDNGGGSDLVWMNTLSAIVKDTLPYNIKMAFKDTKMMRKKFQKDLKEFKKQKLEWLDNEKYWIITGDNIKIVPDTNSLRYDKTIYVLSDKNTYSAGHSLANYANLSDKMVSIGQPTGRMVGFGIAPMLFQLKHSKFSFRMPVIIDITNAKEPLDVYQDRLEIEMDLSIEEELLYPNSRNDMRSKEYLYKYDSMFKKVLELK